MGFYNCKSNSGGNNEGGSSLVPVEFPNILFEAGPSISVSGQSLFQTSASVGKNIIVVLTHSPNGDTYIDTSEHYEILSSVHVLGSSQYSYVTHTVYLLKALIDSPAISINAVYTNGVNVTCQAYTLDLEDVTTLVVADSLDIDGFGLNCSLYIDNWARSIVNSKPMVKSADYIYNEIAYSKFKHIVTFFRSLADNNAITITSNNHVNPSALIKMIRG